MTRDGTRLNNLRPPPPVREINVEYIRNMDIIFHGKTDQRITLIDVVFDPGLGFNL